MLHEVFVLLFGALLGILVSANNPAFAQRVRSACSWLKAKVVGLFQRRTV